MGAPADPGGAVAPLSETASAWGWEQAKAALAGALRFGIHPSLDAISEMCEALGRPQDTFCVVQVTGTNGKSSVTRIAGALLAGQGLRTGVYTSPHLVAYSERFGLFGTSPQECAAFDDMLPRAVGMVVEVAAGRQLEPTEFEILTAAALYAFALSGVEVAVLEVGLGGRWDATSVTAPAVAVITGVGLDHTDRLGETLAEIAGDKAHVIKAGSVAVLGPGVGPEAATPILARAAYVGSPVCAVSPAGEAAAFAADCSVTYDVRVTPDRPGGTTVLDVSARHASYAGLAMAAPSYQAANVAVAAAAVECVLGRALDGAGAREALAALTVPGRFELVSTGPPVVLDGAHNPQAAAVLASAVAEAWPESATRPVALIGMLADKDAAGFVAALAPVVSGFLATEPSAGRALSASALASVVTAVTGEPPPVAASVGEGLRSARAASPAGVLVTGSLYTVGEALAATSAWTALRPDGGVG